MQNHLGDEKWQNMIVASVEMAYPYLRKNLWDEEVIPE